ncbi:MAG: PstS family phosphate ABC transporter substrate-binding protein [Patescibacteria group bacterium]
MKNSIVLWVIAAVALIGGFFYFSQGDPSGSTSEEPIVIKGSDTEVQLVSSLAEAFNKENPGASISVTGGGSGVGIAALLNKEIDIANSSRPMSDDERGIAEQNGIDVREFVVARDGLSVIVHSGNPVRELTLDQIGKIYRGEVTDWKGVGGTPGKIVLYGRQSTSGTYKFFQDTVLKGDYSTAMRNMEGTQQIVDAVVSDTNGIGYAGVGYIRDGKGNPRADLKVVLVKETPSGGAVSPLDAEAVLAGKYPIFRPIYQYLAGLPSKGSTAEAFLRFEVSPEGIAIVEESGFYALTADDTKKNEALLGLIR